MTGQLGVIAALVGIIVPVSCLRYELALPLVVNDADALRLFQVVLGMVAVAGALSILSCGLVQLLHLHDAIGELEGLLWFLPMIVIGAGILNCVNMWCNRIGAFGILSRNRVMAVLVNGVIVVGAGLLGHASSFWLLLGLLMSGFGCVAYTLKKLKGAGTFPAVWPARGGETPLAIRLLKQFKQFPQFNAPMTLMDQAAAMSPALLFASYFSTSVTGQFNLSLSVLRIPASLLGAAVAQVFYHKASGLLSDAPQLRRLVLRTSIFLLLVAVPMALVIALFGPARFELVFSAKWRTSGEYSQVLVCSAAMLLVLSPTSMLPSLLNLQHKHFVIAACSSVLRIALLWWGCTTGDVIKALIWFTFAEVVGGLVYVVWVIRELYSPSLEAPA